MMPEYLPFTPTVSGGNIDKSQDILRIDYLNEKSNKTLALEAHVNDLNLKSAKGEYFNLNNGIKAEIINDQSIDFLFINFKVNDLTYLIGINKNKYPDIEECIKELKKVANSIK
ncbi:hypothetical protein [Halalkalibacter okhensis]|uniref:DUF4367 domain-containing protein n=1 Tax=Halalkalibacter okhensis TaxID=333138 RepID=A0A0B0IEP9_9BACI|nr:hypothetical protein [Halalkalibacter okhensis]KHF38539.1 hypothetical protein LQ50_20510 [Halalkalibacter okhensis]